MSAFNDQFPTSDVSDDLLGRAYAWWRERRERDELAGLSAAEFGRIARDLSLSDADLRDLSEDGDKGASLMRRMAQARGLDLDQARSRNPDQIRDMAVACARCGEKKRCAHDLAEGTAAVTSRDYCPNAETFELLSA
jgi:hypothetical protein